MPDISTNACNIRMNAKLLNWQHVYKVRPYRDVLNDIVSRAVLTSPDVAKVETDGDKVQVNVVFAGPSQISTLR